MNILFTNAHPFLRVHEAFKLETLDAWAREFGFIVYARLTPGTDPAMFDYIRDILTNTYWSPPNLNDRELGVHMNEFIREHQPNRIVNNLEIFLPWDEIETDVEKMYFVRSCAAKLQQVIREQYDGSLEADSALANYGEYVAREQRMIAHSDTFITDSPNSVAAIHEMYENVKNVEICLEYVNPAKYLEIPISDIRSSEVYFVGRLDFQKGLQNVANSSDIAVKVIGHHEVNSMTSSNNNFIHLGLLKFEEYVNSIEKCNFGIFPSIWESNGYTVQECLAMGKIPIVQRGSGGNERLVVDGVNGYVIDFKTESWSDKILNTSWEDIQRMQEAAKATLTYEMYRSSLVKFANILTK